MNNQKGQAMIEPAVIVCDLCQQRLQMRRRLGAYGHLNFVMPDDWDQKLVNDREYHICSNKACMTLFRKQCEVKA